MPADLKENWRPSARIRWSISLIEREESRDLAANVNSISDFEGSGSPLGWVCTSMTEAAPFLTASFATTAGSSESESPRLWQSMVWPSGRSEAEKQYSRSSSARTAGDLEACLQAEGGGLRDPVAIHKRADIAAEKPIQPSHPIKHFPGYV